MFLCTSGTTVYHCVPLSRKIGSHFNSKIAQYINITLLSKYNKLLRAFLHRILVMNTGLPQHNIMTQCSGYGDFTCWNAVVLLYIIKALKALFNCWWNCKTSGLLTEYHSHFPNYKLSLIRFQSYAVTIHVTGLLPGGKFYTRHIVFVLRKLAFSHSSD